MKFTIDSTTEHVQSTGGLALAGKISEKIGFNFPDEKSKQQLVHPEMLRVMYGLFIQGRSSFEEIKLFRYDPFFKQAFDLSYVPAAETLRLYLEKIAEGKDLVLQKISECNIRLLQNATFTPIRIFDRNYIPVDVDVSPFDNSKSHKEGVSRTYKGYDGFAPIFSYIGEDGYMLDCEQREGKQHCQKDTPGFLEHNIEIIKKLDLKQPVLFRLDGGNDAASTIKMLANSGHFFLIKRNLRKESPDYWLDTAEAEGEIIHNDDKKTVYRGVHTGRTPAGDESIPAMDIIFKVTKRYVDKKGEKLLFPKIDVETYWTNLIESPADVIELYHARGTSEQFHSELKSDMGIERLPSGKFAVNAVLLHIAMIAFNALRLIGQTALGLKEELPYDTNVIRKRLRKVIDDLIRVGCKLIYHSRKWTLKFWDHDPWLPVFSKLYETFCSL
jgi:Transposase DDE domain group 1